MSVHPIFQPILDDFGREPGIPVMLTMSMDEFQELQMPPDEWVADSLGDLFPKTEIVDFTWTARIANGRILIVVNVAEYRTETGDAE